jgi:flagellar motor switch protein FliG
MTSKEVEITFRVKPEQAAALLEFLSCVLRADIMRALDSPEQVQAFDFASERLRVVLRKVVEPDEERDEEPDQERDEEPDVGP